MVSIFSEPTKSTPSLKIPHFLIEAYLPGPISCLVSLADISTLCSATAISLSPLLTGTVLVPPYAGLYSCCWLCWYADTATFDSGISTKCTGPPWRALRAFLQRMMRRIATITANAPKATPMPIPACAPLLRPVDEWAKRRPKRTLLHRQLWCCLMRKRMMRRTMRLSG